MTDPREDLARREARVFELRRQGQTFAAIGAELGLSRQRVHQIYTEALAEIPAGEVEAYRKEQVERLDDLLERAYRVLDAVHPLVQGGKVVTEGGVVDGVPVGERLLDDGPVLAAIQAVLRVEERRARLLGLDAPAQVDLGGGVEVTYRVVGVPLEALT